MRERELATLLIQMGVDSGLDIEGAADELATVAFPRFVNARTFKAALLEAIEIQMRAQMEQRLQAMRQRFDVSDTSGRAAPTIVRPSDSSSTPVPQASPSSAPDRSAATEDDMLNTIVSDVTDDSEGSSDDTIVWSPRRD